MTRRDAIKLGGVVAAGTALNATASDAYNLTVKSPMFGKSNGKRVVVIGGGFAGLTTAKYIRQHNQEAEVILLERRDIFMSCPYSNLYLGGIEGVKFTDLIHDFYEGAEKHGYKFIQTEVTGVDRISKTVFTTTGEVPYDLLVVAPGIEYRYHEQFPTWSFEKIQRIKREAPAAFIPGSEHLALKRNLENLKEGNVVITVPQGKYRCPPAPYERACMIAHHIKTHKLPSKVIIIDPNEKPASKAAAFREAWEDLYPGIVEFRGESEIIDVDLDNQKLTYRDLTRLDKNDNYVKVTLDYAILNLIPIIRASSMLQKMGLQVNTWGAAIQHKPGYRSVTDDNIYVVGDCVGYPYPSSGQMANSMSKICGKQIALRLAGKSVDETETLPMNVCFSMVGGKPQEAIMVTHNVTWFPQKKDLEVKGNVPKKDGKYRSAEIAEGTHAWFSNIKEDLFL